jgi:hypothetical protein
MFGFSREEHAADPISKAMACPLRSTGITPRSDFSATFTTIAFDDSSLRWLEINT